MTTTVEELAEYLDRGFDQLELENAFDLYNVDGALHVLLNGHAVSFGSGLTHEFELNLTVDPRLVAEVFLTHDAEWRLRPAPEDMSADEEEAFYETFGRSV